MLEAINFDYRMPYLNPEQLHARYGQRTKPQIHDDNIRGKIAEFAVHDMFINNGIRCDLPNRKVWVHGPDKGDLKIYTKDKPKYYRELEVKSTSPRGKCLLLNKSKWMDKKGNIGNQDHRNDNNEVTKTIPNIFIAVNVTDGLLFKNMYNREQQYKQQYKYNKHDRYKKFLNSFNVPSITTEIMGMLSGGKFKYYASRGTKNNLTDYIPTALGSWGVKRSNVWNFAFPYNSSFIVNHKLYSNMMCMRNTKYCLNALVKRNDNILN